MTRTRNKPSGGGGGVAVADSHYVTNTTTATGNHHHHGQHHHHGHHHHHHHDGHHVHHHHHGGHNGSNSTIIDPATLLARGYTGRYLGLTSTSTSTSSNIIKALSTNEIERDLRHMQAYHEAATRYHILTYTATNRVALLQQQQLQQAQMDAVNNGGGAIIVGVSSHPLVPTDLSVLPSGTATTSVSTSILPLPIRIDPEHEKRVIAEKKRIQHAEAIREELEQQYVSLRAHYILTTQQLQNSVQQSEFRTTQFLQPTIETYSKALGLQRTRLQMARDVLGAMKLRTTAIVEADVAAANNNQKAAGGGGLGAGGMSTTTSSIMSDPTQFAAGADTCPLITTWYGVEEEWKKLYNNTTNNNNKKSKGSNKADGTTSILPWPCTVEPVTAPGVPQLVSCMSTAPDKSIALQAGNKNHKKQGGAPFGATSSSSLTWIESHLPKITTGGGGSGQKETETTTLAELRGQVQSLQAELDSEREKNQKLLTATGKARGLQDEWVAMISLVRQETEAVLHRHNVLLESDEVREAVAHAEEQRKRQKTQQQQQQPQPQPPAAVDEQQPPAPPHPDGGGGRKEVEPEPQATAAAARDETAPPVAAAATATTRPTAAESSTGRNNDDEGANEADDEGMVEEGEEVDDSWETGNNNNKRSAGEQGTSSSPSPPSNRKRRKL